MPFRYFRVKLVVNGLCCKLSHVPNHIVQSCRVRDHDHAYVHRDIKGCVVSHLLMLGHTVGVLVLGVCD